MVLFELLAGESLSGDPVPVRKGLACGPAGDTLQYF
jgi:hypothetical protein